MKMSKTDGTTLCSTALLLLCCIANAPSARAADAVPAGLIHRYSFQDGKANDSVGKINGHLEGGAKIADGQLQLNNLGRNSGDAGLDYLSFPQRVLPKNGSTTIEVWFTSKCDGNYARVFDFGERGQGYLFLTPDEGNDTPRAAITAADFGEEATLRSAEPVNDNKLHMAALVVNAQAGNLLLYVDGRRAAVPVAMGDASLEKINGYNFWLGKSIFETDTGFTGTFKELRIFDRALKPDEIKAHSQAGPADFKAPKKAD